MSLLLAAAIAASAPVAITAEGDPVDVVDAAARERGDRSQVLVLGTWHLSALPKEFDLDRFDALLDRLEEWAVGRAVTLRDNPRLSDAAKSHSLDAIKHRRIS